MFKKICLFHSRIKKSLHQNENNIPNFPHTNPLGREETMVYPKNQGNPDFSLNIHSKSYLEIIIKRHSNQLTFQF